MSPFISIFSINIVLLTNDQKEAIVIEMLKAKRPIRDIAKAAQKSFSDIGEIKRRILGESASYKKKKKLSKVAQALELFSKNKTPIEVAVELDLDPNDIEKIYSNYLRLNGLHQLVKIYQELGKHLPHLVKFYWSLIEAGADNKKIKEILDEAERLDDINIEIKNRQNVRKNLDIQLEQKNKKLQFLDNQIEDAINILSIEYSNLERLNNEISDHRKQLQNLNKLINNIQYEDEYKNLEKKIEGIIKKIIDERSINLPLILIAVFEAFKNDPSKYDIIFSYLNTFKNDNIIEDLQLKENYLYFNNINLFQEIDKISKKLSNVYANKIISHMTKI